MRVHIRRMARIGLCAALLCVCAWIAIPAAVPFTMQSFAVLLVAALLPAADGVIAVLIYLCMGAVGLPVFSAMQGGVGVLLGPTGGFLFGFVLAAACMVPIKRCMRGFGSTALCMALSQVVCYLSGTLWFSVQGGTGLLASVPLCVLPYLLPDAMKLLLAAWFSVRLKGAINR